MWLGMHKKKATSLWTGWIIIIWSVSLALCSESPVPAAFCQEKIRAQEQWESQGASFVWMINYG